MLVLINQYQLQNISQPETSIVLVCERTTAECPSLSILWILAKLASHDSGIDGLDATLIQRIQRSVRSDLYIIHYIANFSIDMLNFSNYFINSVDKGGSRPIFMTFYAGGLCLEVDLEDDDGSENNTKLWYRKQRKLKLITDEYLKKTTRTRIFSTSYLLLLILFYFFLTRDNINKYVF